MEFLKNIGKAVGEAVSFVGEKNRKAAYLNRIRAVIRCEEKAAEKEYLALGRYYYNNLRDKNNPVTESHCAELEAIEGRLDKALDQLEQFYYQAGSEAGEAGKAAFAADGDSEEVTLDDVAVFDHDPTAGSEEASQTASESAAPVSTAPAEPDENDSLPFEG